MSPMDSSETPRISLQKLNETNYFLWYKTLEVILRGVDCGASLMTHRWGQDPRVMFKRALERRTRRFPCF